MKIDLRGTLTTNLLLFSCYRRILKCCLISVLSVGYNVTPCELILWEVFAFLISLSGFQILLLGFRIPLLWFRIAHTGSLIPLPSFWISLWFPDPTSWIPPHSVSDSFRDPTPWTPDPILWIQISLPGFLIYSLNSESLFLRYGSYGFLTLHLTQPTKIPILDSTWDK